MKEKYFAASNSAEGFCSYYNSAFNSEKLSRIYIIKGGSGTGKAFFMKQIASEAEKRGMSVRYIYCSSDSESLDGVIVKEMKVALLDGTAPHTVEPRLVGTLETLVDLGAFLNERMLESSRKTIEEIYAKKQNGFERAYGYLSAYKSISLNIEKLVGSAIKHEKIKKYAEGVAKELERGEGCEEHLLVRSVGMRGLSYFDTYYQSARVYYEIVDCLESAHFLLAQIRRALLERGVSIRVSNDPIIKERLNALSVNEGLLAFEIGNGERKASRTVNMKRFCDADALSRIKNEIRNAQKIRDGVLELALCEFEQIRKYHFLLEEIYGSAMDFSAKEQFTDEFCQKLFQRN